MKRLLIVLVSLCAVVSAFAQDLITKKDGTDIKAKITEVNNDNVKYKRSDNPNGPTYTISKSEILMIIYGNGVREIFNTEEASGKPEQKPSPKASDPVAKTVRNNLFISDPSQLEEGLKYRHLKDLYDRDDFSKLDERKYSPGLAWINLAVPGLSQFIMGEGGLGARYLIWGAVNSGLMTAGAYLGRTMNTAENGTSWVPLIVTGAGAVGYLITTFASISNASKVAKVKSLYNHDLNAAGLGYSFSIDAAPFVAPVHMGDRYVAAAGLSLTMRF
ncbi:MAG: hypothetical protein IJ636_03935 [Bacteroidales bacterium]|nr:hypothetical protein [Bacteroidales bacterium]